jgi:hypothetical protein
MVCLRVLACTGGVDCGRPCANFPPSSGSIAVPILRCALAKRTQYDRVDVHPRALEPGKSPSHLARRRATAELQLAAVMVTRIRIIQRCTRGRFAPTTALQRASSYSPVRAMAVRRARNAASFYVHLLGVRFSCGGWCIHIFQWTRRGRGWHICGCPGGLALLESHGASTPL